MAHRHVGAATSLCHIPLRPSLCCISLPYPSAASCACSKACLSAGRWGTGHAPSGSRAACCTPAGAGCASLSHWLRAGKLGHARIRLLRLSGCRINLRSRLASPARFNLHGHSSRLALPLFLGRAGIRQSGGSAACACCLALPHTATAQHGYRACHAQRAIGNSAQRFLRQPCVGTSRLLGRKAAAAAHLWQAYWLVPIDHITTAATPGRVWQPNAPCLIQASCPTCATQSHASITIGLANLSRQLTGGKSTVKYCSNKQYVDLASFFSFLSIDLTLHGALS